MSKSKTYKSKKGGVDIFVVLGVILVVLVAVILIINGVQNAKITSLMRDYTEYVYGEGEKVKMTHASGDGYDLWQGDDYIYDVLNGIIYDYNKNELDASYVTVAIENAVNSLEDGSAVSNLQYVSYTDVNDFSKEYNGIVFMITNTENVVESTDAAAEKIWSIISASEGTVYTGIEVSMFDMENEYSVYIDAMGGDTLTLEAVKENLVKAEENSALYGYWLATVEANANVELESGEGDVSEGEVADETAEESYEEAVEE